MRKRLLSILACLTLTSAGALWLGSAVLAQGGSRILCDLLSDALSSSTSRVSIGAVDGVLSGDATIRNVAVSDGDGPWLKLDRARLVWRRTALFARRLEVDRLELGRLEIARRPVSARAGRPWSEGPLLPELPLQVVIKAFSLTVLELGAPLLGTSERFAATGAARLGPPKEGLELSLDAHRIDAPGRASLRLAFVPNGERLDLRVEHDEPTGGLAARLANLPGMPALRFGLTGHGVLDDWAATLTGAIGGQALAGSVRLRRSGSNNIAFDDLDLELGSTRVAGRAAVDSAGFAEGTVRIAAPDLNILSPLGLTPIQGQLDGTLTLLRSGDRQNVRLVAGGRDLSAGSDLSLGAFDADVSASDLLGRPVLDGRLTADRLTAGGETFDQIRLTANGAEGASDLKLAATARAFQLGARARLVPGEQTRIDLDSFTARRGDQRFALAGPASITIEGRSAVLSNLVVTTGGGGRVSLKGTVGEQFNLAVSAQSIPLSIAEILRPGVGLAGTLAGAASLHGDLARPEGSYQLSVSRVVTPRTRGAGLPPIDASASGTLAEDGATLDASASAGAAAGLRATGRVPWRSADPIALRISGQADAALANAALQGQLLTGRMKLDADLGGTLGAPQIEGTATLVGGTFTDPLKGIRLSGIEGQVTGRGDTLMIERFTAATRNGGTLSAVGRITLDPPAGFPAQIRLRANQAELLASEIVAAVANLDLSVEGPIMQQPRVAGRVDLVSMDVSIPDRLPTTIRPLAGTRHIAAPSQVRARLTAEQKAEAQARRGRVSAPSAFDAALDLTVAAPNRIFVRGRGVDAELGGDLRLTGSSKAPIAVGAFDLRRGWLTTVVGQRLDFSRGRLSFTGDLAPELDFIAQTQAGNVTAQVEVSGPATQPVFALTSQPALPQDEVLSRLLFAKPSGNLSAFQALQLAQAVAQLSGEGGSDVFDRTRRALGVDSLDINTGAHGGSTVGASRYIGNRLSVGVRAGAKPEDSAATATIDVTRRLKVQGGIGADGRSSVGIGAEWEY